jgi:hypothetical protein
VFGANRVFPAVWPKVLKNHGFRGDPFEPRRHDGTPDSWLGKMGDNVGAGVPAAEPLGSVRCRAAKETCGNAADFSGWWVGGPKNPEEFPKARKQH